MDFVSHIILEKAFSKLGMKYWRNRVLSVL
jgi:hypothetical protein